jgi:hypothetical protein
MTFEDKPTFENVGSGPFNTRHLEMKYFFEHGLVFECDMLVFKFHALKSGAFIQQV